MPYFSNKNQNAEQRIMIMPNNATRPTGISQQTEYSDDAINIINEYAERLTYTRIKNGHIVVIARANWRNKENFMINKLQRIYGTDDNPCDNCDVWSNNDVLQHMNISDAKAETLSLNKEWKQRLNKLNKTKFFVIARNFDKNGFEFITNGITTNSEISDTNSAIIWTQLTPNGYSSDELGQRAANLRVFGSPNHYDWLNKNITLFWSDSDEAMSNDEKMDIDEDDDDAKAQMEHGDNNEHYQCRNGDKMEAESDDDNGDDDDAKAEMEQDNNDESMGYEIRAITGVTSEIGSHVPWFQCTLLDENNQFVEGDPDYIGWEPFMCPENSWQWDDDTTATIIDFLLKNNSLSIL